MIEQRKLTSEELDMLFLEASDSEKRGFMVVCQQMKMTPLEILKAYAFDWDGLVINNRPVYLAGIFSNGKNFEFWTIVNSDVKEQIALFRCAKKGLRRWLAYVPEIYATMMKSWEKNRFWTERLGFKPCKETEDTITFVIKRGN